MHTSYSNLGFDDFQQDFDATDSDQLHKAIQTLLYYSTVIPDAFITVMPQGVNKNFLTLSQGKIHLAEYYLSSSFAYSSNLHSISLWGNNPTFPIEDYLNFMGAYNEIFNDDDFLFFIGYHNAGTSTHSTDTNKAMIEYIWRVYFKSFFELESENSNGDGEIFDFTRDNYLS